jgi:anti-sigma factor RsiW
LWLLDDDLSPAEQQSLESHLSECSACQRRLEELRDTCSTYLEFHESVLKPALVLTSKSRSSHRETQGQTR